MNRTALSFVKAVDRLSRLAEILTEIGLVALMLMVFKEVIWRYVLDHPSTYSVEVSEYILIFMTFMAAAWVQRQERHVNMTMLTAKLPERATIVLDVLTSLLTMGLCAIIVWTGTKTVIMSYNGNYRSASLLSFPLWIPYSFICLGFGLLFLQYIARLVTKISRFVELGER